MLDSTHLGTHHHPKPQRETQILRRRQWCCSFTTPPLSPDYTAPSRHHSSSSSSSRNKKTEVPSYTSETQQQQRPPFARRILSPGRVSPISDHPVTTQDIPPKQTLTVTASSIPPADTGIGVREGTNLGDFDVRLNLRGKNGESLVLELGSKVLSANSTFFADSIANCPKNSSGVCRIEMPVVENVNVFRETIELMFEDEIQKKLQKIGVFRAIDTLEVSAGIKFVRGVTSCLDYLDAVPWSEQEEEKLRELFSRCNFEDYATTDILDRLYYRKVAVDTQRALSKYLICSVTTGRDANARNELKSLVKGLLCKSSVYEKKYPDLNLDIFANCQSCLASLQDLLESSGSSTPVENFSKKVKERPLLESISNQVDNINWLVDILLDNQGGEEFVDLWANQEVLLQIHQNLSPMVRYELSRVSAVLFIAMGTRKLHCRSETRLHFLQMWFKPMLCDFSWLQRCRKGLDMKVLEESMGQTLLTLPLNDQYDLFMDWFRCFSKNGTDPPNLGKAFQIWWRRSFQRGSETFSLELR